LLIRSADRVAGWLPGASNLAGGWLTVWACAPGLVAGGPPVLPEVFFIVCELR